MRRRQPEDHDVVSGRDETGTLMAYGVRFHAGAAQRIARTRHRRIEVETAPVAACNGFVRKVDEDIAGRLLTHLPMRPGQ